MRLFTHQTPSNRGMTLVELMVVLAIFMIVAGITIFDYGRFRSNVSLQNLADDIALSIRRTQGYAIGVHGSQPSDFTNGYGIHFATTEAGGDPLEGSRKNFIIFADISNPKNKIYEHNTSETQCNVALSSDEECLELVSITSNDIVYAICPDIDPSDGCAPGVSSKYADISFLRPDPNAAICVGDVGSPCSFASRNVAIVIKNLQSEETKRITVSTVGQIAVE